MSQYALQFYDRGGWRTVSVFDEHDVCKSDEAYRTAYDNPFFRVIVYDGEFAGMVMAPIKKDAGGQ